ncbi:MAG: hypothetical protein EOP39_14725 [Rubrivivax sp.]|nr:MAG: hypothetical protein EOP39_14725 [Rubrivivax sp.]
MRCLPAVSLTLGLAFASTAQALYTWETVTLPASSGASCGNGTPYRFFVNTALLTRNLVVEMEGGGACWDQRACEGQGALSANNPDGIPANHMTSLNTAAGLVAPFTTRLNAIQPVRTQFWNQAYLPYCTGDVHTGAKLRVYGDADPAHPRVQHHRGQANVRAAAAWLRANLGKPDQLLVTGFSAGGVGATANYGVLRDALAPTGRASLIADSGPLYPAPRGGTAAQYPSLALHNRIRDAWGLDDPGSLLASFAGQAGFDTNDLGSLSQALALRYPGDRFAYAVFGADEIFSAFSYAKFDPQVAAAAGSAQLALLTQRFQQDIDHWLPALGTRPNIGWYVPWYRNLVGSHCLSIIDFSNTGIEAQRVASFASFVDNTLDRGAPMRVREAANAADAQRPLSVPATVMGFLLGLFGVT